VTLHRLAAGVLALVLVVAALPANAGTARLSIGFDSDNNPATGCTLNTANGPVPGIEAVATTVIGTNTTGATVARLERQLCSGGVLGAPVTYDNGGWAAGLGNGTGGSAAVETSVPLALFPPGGMMRAVVIASDGGAGQDATAPFTVTLAPVTGPLGEVAVPVSPWLLPPLVAAMLALTWWLRRRYPGQGALVVMIAVFAASGLAWAATVLRDGNVNDWAGVLPVVTEPLGDGVANADVVAVYYQQDGANLYFRIDADIRKDAAGNAPPTVSAGVNQSITLPSGASLNGTASDDGLPNPPGVLALTWSKVSGAGTVTFGNPALASTTATFSAAGTYVLRLSAFDGALTASADVTIVVNAGGGGGGPNLPPVVSAGPNQSITLPNVATLAGTATDDGLPAPPGALSSTWSMISGPSSGVVFGDPSQPGTTATFAAPGIYLLQLSASDGALSAASTVQVTVVDGPPVLAAVADRTINLGERLQVLLEGRDGNANDVLTYALTTAPAGATLNPSPLLDWTPTAAQLGTHPFAARVTDSNGNSATISFNVTVVYVNHPPQLGPQASLTMPTGSPFARTLVASDPDAGDMLSFGIVSGPSGMTLSGAQINWSTSGRTPGDYTVTVRVTDQGGLTDQKTFTVTLMQAAPAPVPKDDAYTVKVNHVLTVPAPGVLENDFYEGADALTATRLTNPGLGVLTTFNADGSFVFQAPPTVPGAPLSVVKLWNANAPSDRPHELVADLNGDGYPDIVVFDNNALLGARSGLTGGPLWSVDRTGATDCNINSGYGMDHRVLADIDDSGHPTLVLVSKCDREGSAFHDNLLAIDHTGHVKWVSPPLSKPHPDIRRGSAPVPAGGFTPGGVAYGSSPSVARLKAAGPPVLLMRTEISVNDGYTSYQDAANVTHQAGCRAVTGLVADENVACRATLLVSGTDGSIVQALVNRNPAAAPRFGGPNALEKMPPIAMDIDGDGRVDIVSGPDVWKQNASGGFDLAWQLDKSMNDTAVADLDGDGKAEIIHIRSVSENNVDHRGIFIYSHDGILKQRIPLWANVFTPLTIADVDGDGRSDIVLGADGWMYAFRDDGRPIWAYKVPADDAPDEPILAPYYTPAPQYQQVTVAAPQVYDLDGDGVAEVVFSAYARVMVLDGRTGLRKVQPWWTYNANQVEVTALMLVDMNNDGHVDVVQNSAFIFNCYFSGANFLEVCDRRIGPLVLSGGGGNDWRPGPKVFHSVQYRSTAVDSNARVLHDTKVSRIFRTPEQQGTVVESRLARATSFTYAAGSAAGSSAPARVVIDIVADNEPPVFTSVPPKSLWLRYAPNPPGGHVQHYYNLSAIDPDAGDTVTFSLKSAPSQVTMSGPAQIRFEPACGGPCPWGWTTVVVTATDNHGASTDQIFIVNLTTESRIVPNVVGMLFNTADAALRAVDLQAVRWVEAFSTQPVGTVLAQDAVAGTEVGRFDDVRLTVSKGLQPLAMPFVIGQQLRVANALLTHAGLQVNATTVFSTTIPAGEIVAQVPAAGTLLVPATAPPVELTVSAGGPLSAPVASIVLKPGPGPLVRLAGDDVQFTAIAKLTDGTSADVTLSAVWTSTNTSVATVSTAGFAVARLGGTTTIGATLGTKAAQITLNVAPLVPVDVTPPAAAITSPADGAAVTGPVAIIGTATDANFLRYELAYAPAGEDTWTLLAEGNSAVANGTLGTFDPTTLLNDLYTLRLTVFDKGQNESTAMVTVQAKGARKIGLFSLTYLDLSIPAAGIPLTVSRTYDSRDKAKGDFGVGWRLGLNTLRIRANRVPGTGWARVVNGALVSLLPTSEHKVSIVLPDGRVEEFDMVVSPTSNLGSLDFTAVTGYAARAGTLGKLEALGNTSLAIVNAGAGVELVDDATFSTYAPQFYRYTTVDGTQIEVGPVDGVRKVTDRSGNTVTFGPGGILHSNGTGIVFTRDAKDRIVAITDVLGRAQTYAYDSNGDLVAHTSAVGGVSTFAYDQSHGLVEIRDATGNRASRNEYDVEGRLIAMTDAAGNRVEFNHNTAAQQDIITDRRGNQTQVTYDDTGNVVAMQQAVTIAGTLVSAVSTATYDAQGNETSRVDADGRRNVATYTGRQLLTESTDPAGLNLTNAFAYNARNDVANATDAGGRIYTFTYSAGGILTDATTPLTGLMTSQSNAQGQPTQSVDAVGTVTTNTRDAAGRVVREEVRGADTVLLRRIDYTYDANGNRTSETLHRTINGVVTPLTTSYAYDAANRLITLTDPAGGVSRTEYDAADRVTATVDPLGRRTTITYDTLGRRIRTTLPDGTFVSVTYDANGNLASQTDAAGRTVSFAYDELNRQVRTTLPDGTFTQVEYTAGGRVAANIDAKGNRTDIVYDAAGRPVKSILPAVANGVGGLLVRPEIVTTLNALGAPTSVLDANGRTTLLSYDAAGRLVQTTFADGTSIKQAYDAAGRRIGVTNEEAQVSQYTLDGLGRIVAVAGLAGDASYGYDEAGNLVTQTDALGRVTKLSYDALNRLTRRQYPGGESEQFAYDAVGNLVASTDANGKTITMLYDAMDRLIRKNLPGGASVVIAYTADGKRSTVTDSRGVTAYAYDALGQLAGVTHPGGATVGFNRDANGNLLSLASPAATVSYGYDALDRLTQITSPDGQGTQVYDLGGNRVRTTVPGGVHTDYTYDLRNRVSTIAHKSAGNAVLRSFSNAYSPSGRRTQVVDDDGSTESYAYDAKGRLTSESRTGTGPFAITHAYDAVGNRTQVVRNGIPKSLAYDLNDRLVVDGTATNAYDQNGNLVTHTDAGVTTLYGYDAENRVVAIQGGGLANLYSYDADGNRVLASNAQGLRRFLVDSVNNTGLAQVLEERDGGGALAARFVYGNELHAMAQGANVRAYLRDAHGSMRLLTDPAGTVTDTYAYDAYGGVIATTGATNNPYRYSGERLDADTGLYQLRARYYDPGAGRFITRDRYPGDVAAPRSLHRYLYADADPVNLIDPTGLYATVGEFSLAGYINSMIDAAELTSTVGKACTAYSTLEQVQDLIFATSALTHMLVAANTLQQHFATGNIKKMGFAGKGDLVLFSIDNSKAKAGSLKKISAALVGGGGRVGVKTSLEVAGDGSTADASRTLEFEVSGPPLTIKGAGGGKVKAYEKKFDTCGAPVGKITSELNIKAYAGNHAAGAGVSSELALKFELFNGRFSASLPLMGVDMNGGKGTMGVTILGVALGFGL
jgi:RHS repeat-associated protein